MSVFHDISMNFTINKEKARQKCAACKVSTVERSKDIFRQARTVTDTLFILSLSYSGTSCLHLLSLLIQLTASRAYSLFEFSSPSLTYSLSCFPLLCYVGQPSYRSKINKANLESSLTFFFLKAVCLSTVTVAKTYSNSISTNDKLWFETNIYSFEEKKIEMY